MSLEAALREFHLRDWVQDVEILDRELAARRYLRAGLVSTPPSIITGDPFALEAGRCVLLLGINPGWRAGKLVEIDANPARSAWEQGFDIYRDHRSSYFRETSGPPGKTKKGDARYSPHFSRLGNFIACALGVARTEWNPGPIARQFFRSRAAIFDLIPYWSTDTQAIDFTRLNPTKQPCVREWHGVIEAFVAEKQPVAVIVNNCGHRSLINAMLGTELEAVAGTRVYAGIRYDGARTPVLAHPFLGRWRGSHRDHIQQFERAARHIGLQLPADRLADESSFSR